MRTNFFHYAASIALLAGVVFLAGCEGRTIKTAIPLELGEKVEGVLRKGAPMYYKFDAKAQTLYQILVRESILIRLTLMTEDGRILDYQSDVGKAYWPGISFLEDGAYILRIEAATDVYVEYPAYGDPEMLFFELMVRETPDILTTTEEDFVPLIRDGDFLKDRLDFFNQPKYYKIDVPAIMTGVGAINRYHVRIDTLKYAPRVIIATYDANKRLLATNLNRLIVNAAETPRTYYLALRLNYDDVRNDVSWEYAQTDYEIVFQKIPIIGLSPPEINIAAAGGQATITVDTTTGSPIGKYFCYSEHGWISITSGAEGKDEGTIVISCERNENAWARTGYVYVTSQFGGSRFVEVRQRGN